MQYRIRALDAEQQVRTLLLDALDEADARARVSARQLMPITILPRSRMISGQQAAFSVLLFAKELQSLLAAGLSAMESLETLTEKEAQTGRRTVIERLVRALQQGERLSTALGQQPTVFPPLLVGVVQAAEGMSDLPHALTRYIDYETRLDGIRERVVSASIYPAILLAVGGAVTFFLLGYVVPRFAAIYDGGGKALPWASQLLMAWGRFIGAHAQVVLLVLAGSLAMAILWTRRHYARDGWSKALGLLPGVKARIDVLEVSRLYLTLGMLLEGGIPILQAISLASASVSRGKRDEVEAVRADVALGKPLSVALDRFGLSTPVALRLLRVGERTGRLGLALTRSAGFHEAETARWIEHFTKTFEPVLMAAIGVVIGLIVIPVYASL